MVRTHFGSTHSICSVASLNDKILYGAILIIMIIIIIIIIMIIMIIIILQEPVTIKGPQTMPLPRGMLWLERGYPPVFPKPRRRKCCRL